MNKNHEHRWGPWRKGARGRKMRQCLVEGCTKAQNPRGIIWDYARAFDRPRESSEA